MLERVVVLRFAHAHKDVLLLGLALRHVDLDKCKDVEDISAMMKPGTRANLSCFICNQHSLIEPHLEDGMSSQCGIEPVQNTLRQARNTIL